jgi:thioredoxin-dependent peroxiredoxin
MIARGTKKPTKKATKKSTKKRASAHAAAPTRAALGRKVPDITLPATGGRDVRLRDLRGRKVVLYFYPRDNTPGCTLEGRQFAALAPQFERAGVALLGVSRDSIASHDRFREQHSLPFDLLSDPEERACRLFDVIREKKLYGRTMLGVERSTFLIDAEGTLRREWRRVKVEGHAREVLEAAQSL